MHFIKLSSLLLNHCEYLYEHVGPSFFLYISENKCYHRLYSQAGLAQMSSVILGANAVLNTNPHSVQYPKPVQAGRASHSNLLLDNMPLKNYKYERGRMGWGRRWGKGGKRN